MRLLIKISLRNLLRQKQRSILLGIGIAFGMTVLILANSFSNGLSDVLLNRIIKVMTGHFMVTMMEKPEKRVRSVVRDKERFIELIQENVEGQVLIREGITTQSMGGGHMPVQALGNAASAMIMIIGIPREGLMEQENVVLAGRVESVFEDQGLENPILLFDSIAEELNVQLHDTISVRFSTIYGQVQAARFTVVAILEAANPFMGMAAFTSQETLKPLLAMKEQETGSFSVVIENLDNPKRVIRQAENLHRALQPGVAGFIGRIGTGHQSELATVWAVDNQENSAVPLAQALGVDPGRLQPLWTTPNGVMVSEATARALGLAIGNQAMLDYDTKFEGSSDPYEVHVVGILPSSPIVSPSMVLVHPQVVYDTSLQTVPKEIPGLAPSDVLFPLLLKEWILLEMSPDQASMMKKFETLADREWRGLVIDVATMYAVASEVLQMELVLGMVTLVAVLILFFIILIGVINTLRMTIRERTREIGTVRAIGMQRSDVRWSFVLEVVFLTFFASLAGIVISLVVIRLLGFIELNVEGMFSIFLVERRLHFLPTVLDIGRNLVIILAIAAVTAFIPAGRAAKMGVADALRHVE
jgi:ABC-type lipoprotein release transport system permease subunit